MESVVHVEDESAVEEGEELEEPENEEERRRAVFDAPDATTFQDDLFDNTQQQQQFADY